MNNKNIESEELSEEEGSGNIPAFLWKPTIIAEKEIAMDYLYPRREMEVGIYQTNKHFRKIDYKPISKPIHYPIDKIK